VIPIAMASCVFVVIAVAIGGVVGFFRHDAPAPAVGVAYCSGPASAGSSRCKTSLPQGGATSAHETRFAEGGEDG
jgi:hypothetical protein